MFVRLTQKTLCECELYDVSSSNCDNSYGGGGRGGGAYNQKNHCRFHVLIGGRKIKLKFLEISDKKYIHYIKMTVL